MDYYNWVKAFHVISIIAWMAAMLYLPRLFIYHIKAEEGSELSETLKIMERRLLRVIMNPAMMASFVFGIWLIVLDPTLLDNSWIWVKVIALFGLVGVHTGLARYRQLFSVDRNTNPEKFYRLLNETITILMIIIIIMVVVKPF